MAAYKVGGLEIDLTDTTNNTQVLNDLQVLSRRINSLQKSLSALNSVGTSTAFKTIRDLFSAIKTATATLDPKIMSSFTEISKAFSSIAKIKNFENFDFNKIGNGFTLLAEKITPFLNKIKESETALNSLSTILKNYSKATNTVNLAETNKGTLGGGLFSLKNLFNFGKLRVAFYYANRIGKAVAKIAQFGSDYLETLNLWAVAMRENLDSADEFVNKMTRAYGIGETTIMRAQATFRNMIGSLGQISQETAYELSEAITQMAVDYASLYNVQIETAFNKFEAMLAGQVRPIRSGSGYDITETTLYQLYQDIGGTKTMRQLNRTEKQLLSILAVYRQMNASGALGDMSKTINQFANQSRIMTEQWERIKTYSGVLVRNFIDSNKILIYINAGLITISEILKALASATSDTSPDQFLDGLLTDAIETDEAIEELQGKLLDFDKIRALDTSTSDSPLAIDQTVLDALSNYSSYIDDSKNEAQQLADEWLKNLGLVDANNDGILDLNANLQNLVDTLKTIGIFLGVLVGLKIAKHIWSVVSSIETATLGMKAFSLIANVSLYAGIFLIIYELVKLKNGWDKMTDSEKTARIALIALGVALVTFGTLSKIATAETTALTTALKLQKIAATSAAVGGIALLVANIALLVGNWDKMATWERVVGIFGAIGAAALAAAAAIAAFHGAWTAGTAVVAIVGGLAALAAAFIGFKASMKDLSVPKFANGGILPDKGTLFLAGEEIVYNSGNGNGGVANVQQIAQATYQGTMQALDDWWGGRNAKSDIPQLTEANPTGMYQAVTGVARSYGYKWGKV